MVLLLIINVCSFILEAHLIFGFRLSADFGFTTKYTSVFHITKCFITSIYFKWALDNIFGWLEDSEINGADIGFCVFDDFGSEIMFHDIRHNFFIN